MKGLAVGQKASVTRTFKAADNDAYQDLTGDAGLAFGPPARTTAEFVSGPLLGGMISYLLGTRLPGRGTNWLKQSFTYLQAPQLGEPITATVEITRLRPEKELVNLRTVCTNGSGQLLCTGEALVLVGDLEEEMPMA